MVTRSEPEIGRFSVEIELANNDDMVLARAGHLPQDQVRRIKLRGVVDSGATRLVLPESAARQLGLARAGDVNVRYADNHTARRETVKGVLLTHANRDGVFDAVVEPSRDSALIGAIVMETLDLVIDCGRQILVPTDLDRLTAILEYAPDVGTGSTESCRELRADPARTSYTVRGRSSICRASRGLSIAGNS